MELFKNIFFNTDKLTPYITVKITYAGKFFEDKSQEVFLHYSFNNNWENTKDIKMEKSELGYQAEVNLENNEELNICFFNEKEEWDNNNSNNYNFTIEKSELGLTLLEDKSLLPTKRLSKFYLWKKKFKINLYKAIRFIPKLITGNYKRKIIKNEDRYIKNVLYFCTEPKLLDKKVYNLGSLHFRTFLYYQTTIYRNYLTCCKLIIY